MSSENNLNLLGLVPRANGVGHQLFTAWSLWSPCSKTCGVGFRVRKRSCINPRLFPTGGLCNGLSIQHQSCLDRVCPGKKTLSVTHCLLSACLSTLSRLTQLLIVIIDYSNYEKHRANLKYKNEQELMKTERIKNTLALIQKF